MSSGDGDSLKIAESVHRFLRYVLDQVVYSSVENEKEEGRNHVLEVLDDVIQEAMRISKERENSIHGVKQEEKGTERDDKRHEEIFSGDNTDTDITTDDNKLRKTTSGSNGASSGNIASRFLTRVNISEASAFAEQLESLTNKCDGQQQSQNIKSLQSEYIESIDDENIDAEIRERAHEQKRKVFTPFSKLKKKKTRYGKVKIYHTGDLSADEQKRIVKEATELMKYLKENEKEEKRRKRAAKEKKGIGARILGFFRSLSCCKASTAK